jgi:hypothetical protein
LEGVKTLETKDRITFKIGKKLSPKEIERLIEEGLEELALPRLKLGDSCIQLLQRLKAHLFTAHELSARAMPPACYPIWDLGLCYA